jgi:hypothetical protein
MLYSQPVNLTASRLVIPWELRPLDLDMDSPSGGSQIERQHTLAEGTIVYLDADYLIGAFDDMNAQMQSVTAEYAYETGAGRRSLSLAVQIDAFFAQLRFYKVTVHESEELRSYFIQHSDLLDVVLLSSAIARNEFKQDGQLHLAIFRDAETDDNYPTLYVRQEKYSHDLMPRIEKLWGVYSPHLAQKSGWFLVTTDFA